MFSRISQWAYAREQDQIRRVRQVADQTVRVALLNASGLYVQDVDRDTGENGDCSDVHFESLWPITADEKEQAVLGFAGTDAVAGTYEACGKTCAWIRVRER